MHKPTFVSFLLITFFAGTAAANDYPDQQAYTEGRPIVSIQNGKLEGVQEYGMQSFKNIPYAAPPVGDLRWKPPHPALNWEGVRDASQFGRACIQPAVKGLNIEVTPGVEDCLKLNVYAPPNAKNLPVMVWFHGGGLVEGSASEPYYKPVALVKEGAIVVTVDYRIGKLGFFSPKELIDEGKKNNEPVGNYGTMDQIESLKWVQQNIKAFGGDPNNVTIFGQSAGGRSVTWLMTSPAAKGLFHKAIAESAQQLPLRGQTEVRFGQTPEQELDERYMKQIKVTSLKEARALPAEQLLVTPKEFQDGEFGGAFIDGNTLVGDPLTLFKEGKQHKVPFMIGTNSWDASYFVLGQPPVNALIQKLHEDPAKIKTLYRGYKDTCQLSAQIMADGFYKGAVKILADSQSQYAPSYAYYFDYVTPTIRHSLPGAGHTFEIPYVFGSMAFVLPAPAKEQVIKNQCADITKAAQDMKTKGEWAPYWFPRTDIHNPKDLEISRQMASSWVAFARTGNPNQPEEVIWPKYNLKNDVMRQFSDGKPLVRDLDKARVDYQMEIIRKMYN